MFSLKDTLLIVAQVRTETLREQNNRGLLRRVEDAVAELYLSASFSIPDMEVDRVCREIPGVLNDQVDQLIKEVGTVVQMARSSQTGVRHLITLQHRSPLPPQ